MPNPAQASANPAPPRFSLYKVLPAIGSERRWCILRELAKGESLPVVEVARRLGATPAGISKHFAVLFDSGIVRRTYDRILKRNAPSAMFGNPAVAAGAFSSCRMGWSWN